MLLFRRRVRYFVSISRSQFLHNETQPPDQTRPQDQIEPEKCNRSLQVEPLLHYERNVGHPPILERISIGDRHFDIYDKIKTHCHRRFFEGSLNLDCSDPKKVLVQKEYECIPWCAMQNFTHPNILRPIHIDRSAISSSAFYITYDSDLLYNIDELAFAQKEYSVKRYNGVVFDLSPELKELIWEIMRGLDHLHNQSVAHGNLKNEIYIVSLSPPRAKIGGHIFNGNAMNFCQEARQDLYEVGCVGRHCPEARNSSRERVFSSIRDFEKSFALKIFYHAKAIS